MSAARPPLPLLVVGALVAAAAALPAGYLLVVVIGDAAAARDAVLDDRTLGLLARSAGLAALVTAAATAIALPLAWLTVRSDLPAKRLWATLATLPLVIPSYIGAYVFVSAFGPKGALADMLSPLGVERLPSVYGWVGASIVLTLFTYPLILLAARSALGRIDPQLEEAALAMGRTRREVLRTVVWPQLRPAVAGGAVLVALYVLSDFGAVSIMQFDSFTREIYVLFGSSFNREGAAALGAVLVALMLGLVALQARIAGNSALHRANPGTQRPARPVPLGRWRWPALLFCGVVVTAALIVPVGVLVYWATKGIGDVDTGAIGAYAVNSLLAAGLAAAVAGAAATVIALLRVRSPGVCTKALERAGYAGYVLPGVVVALALVFFGTRVALPLYQTLTMLVFALAMHYLPLAVGPSADALRRLSPRIEEAARGLGRGQIGVFRTITAPLAAGGIAAGTALVFLHAIKELPATLLLAPIGFETLATDIWRQTSFGFFEATAIPALVLLAIAAPPLYLLSEKGTVAS